MANILIEGRVVGQRRPLFTEWELPIPPVYEQGAGQITLKELITQVVHTEVQLFRERQEQNSLVRALTQTDIQRGLMKGKVDSGGREPGSPVDAALAASTAIQAFQDGIYYVFIDEEQQTDLEAPVKLRQDSKVTFLRLVALAGG